MDGASLHVSTAARESGTGCGLSDKAEETQPCALKGTWLEVVLDEVGTGSTWTCLAEQGSAAGEEEQEPEGGLQNFLRGGAMKSLFF